MYQHKRIHCVKLPLGKIQAALCLHLPGRDGSPALIPESERISSDRLCDACDVILSLHNTDGGWATYENNRGARWYELLNPSEVFGDIMIDYSYVEYTSACITALSQFRKSLPFHRAAEVINAIQAGGKFLGSIQREDGSWYGSWGVCFLYGTWFGIEGLRAAGFDPECDEIQVNEISCLLLLFLFSFFFFLFFSLFFFFFSLLFFFFFS